MGPRHGRKDPVAGILAHMEALGMGDPSTNPKLIGSLLLTIGSPRFLDTPAFSETFIEGVGVKPYKLE